MIVDAFASQAKQSSACTKLGTSIIGQDTIQLLQQLVVALGNITAGGGGGGSGTVTSVAQSFTGGLISVAGSPITTSGTLALTVAGTSGGIPYFSSASTWATSAALAANAIVVGGGAGAAPSTVTTGTGVVTALGVNTGSAGAFVVNGGALGTPSSGVATNLTGLPLTTGITGTLAVANGGTGITAFGTGVAAMLGANVTGSGGGVLQTSATLITPLLGTPTSGVLTNCTGLPASSVVAGSFGTGACTFASASSTEAASLLTLTGQTALSAASQPIINATQTWNNAATTFTALKLNITSTASATASLLVDLQTGGSSQFSVRKDGRIVVDAQNNLNGNSAIIIGNSSGQYVGISNYNSNFQIGDSSGNATLNFARASSTLTVASNGVFGFASTTANFTTADTRMVRDAAGILALQNSTNAQTFRIYGTTTGSKYLTLSHNGTNAIISASSGSVLISTLPTSNPGPGILWNNAGTPAIGT